MQGSWQPPSSSKFEPAHIHLFLQCNSHLQTAQSISDEIRSATTSMTSVPKPLKFLRKHYDSIKAYYGTMADSGNKPKLADVLSILAISSAKPDSRESLKFRLAGSKVRTA